ncbi:MAG: hypothetical protein Q9Q13_14705 [Acidobacteriota bacterium]|nr:hypothetical protein [Acidobacteriota bacterium]
MSVRRIIAGALFLGLSWGGITACAGRPAGEVRQLWRLDDAGLSTPESVLWDPRADVYLVSNIVGSPSDEDGDAFIARVSPDGKVAALRWIDSRGAGVRLDAPKGMALVGDSLWVADIHSVRRFDRVSGAPQGSVPIADSVFLNDLCPDGRGEGSMSATAVPGASTRWTPTAPYGWWWRIRA